MRTIGILRDHARDEIPASHLDLVECPPVATLTTIMADGYPQTSVCYDPRQPLRYLEVRGTVSGRIRHRTGISVSAKLAGMHSPK